MSNIDEAAANKMLADVFGGAQKKPERATEAPKRTSGRQAGGVRKIRQTSPSREYILPLREKREIEYEHVGENIVFSADTARAIAMSCHYAVLDRLDDFDVIFSLSSIDRLRAAVKSAVEEGIRAGYFNDEKKVQRKIKVR